tara:strand:+ start:3666 stop:3809 length:144 start_codon:yes stop_codon:yes gene_type:complete
MSKFPDLNKDGKITKADILIGRGVTDKKKKGAKTDKLREVVNAKKGK